jgi:hypothetical protein
MVSTSVSVAAVIADAGVAVLLIAGLAYATRAERRPALLPIGGAVVIGWWVLAFTLAKSGFFETTPDTTMPPRIGPAIVVPTLVGCALLAFASVRQLVARVPLHWLVGVQLYRVFGGGLFLLAWLQGDVPGEFALPAAIGDVTVGILAPLVALLIVRQGIDRAWPAVVAWCALGITDLVVAVTFGLLTAPSTFQQLALDDPNAAITSYPLVLIPTFAVPVSIVLHVYVLARLSMRAQRAPHARLA